MSQKNIAAILLLVATAIGAPPAVNHVLEVQKQVEGSVTIEGPTEVAVGELVELTINGSRPAWLIPVVDARVYDDVALVSFRDEGEYEIIGTAIAGTKSTVVKHVIKVAKDHSVLVPDVAPTPDVVPVPVPEPVQKTSTLTDVVVKWCVNANAPKAGCKAIGNNFIKAATDATSIEDLLSRVAKANRSTNQKGVEQVLAQIQQHLFDNLQGESFEDHRCAFDEIGQGFLQHAGDAEVDTGTQKGLWK